MLKQNQPPLHLTYCLNIHPGETWDENLRAIQNEALSVKKLVSPEKPFGLGLRLSGLAAQQLSDPSALDAFKHCLRGQNMYAFSVNGFPYGQFHGTRVKEAVYQPDWRSALRREYTCRIADALAAVLPDGTEGSISSVPVAYKKGFSCDTDYPGVVENLLETVLHLHRLHETSGRLVHLGLEPEPDCVLETTDEFIRFYQRILQDGVGFLRGQTAQNQEEAIIRRHLGVCFDTCHVALQFEEPTAMLKRYRAEGVRISKIQISAALEVDASQKEALRPFVEPVYLHQAKCLMPDASVRSWSDLPELLADWPTEGRHVRVHFHVPLFWQGTSAVRPTNKTLSSEFWSLLRSGLCSHLEVETYSFGMMPEAVRPPDMLQSLALELKWTMDRLDAGEGQSHGSSSV